VHRITTLMHLFIDATVQAAILFSWKKNTRHYIG